MRLLWKTLFDLKEPAIIFRLFIPFAAGLILVSILGYSFFGLFLTSEMFLGSAIVYDFQAWELQVEETVGAIPLVGGLMLWFIGMAAVVIVGLLSLVLGSYLVLLFAMIITGFMTDTLVKAVHKKHYSHLEYQGHGSFIDMTWKLVKFGLLMLLILLVTIPLLFIPLINIVWFWILGFLFFRYAIVLDVGQVILPKELFQKLQPTSNWESSTVIAVLFMLSFLPLMNLFAPVLAVIAVSHYYFEQLSLSQPVKAAPEVKKLTLKSE